MRTKKRDLHPRTVRIPIGVLHMVDAIAAREPHKSENTILVELIMAGLSVPPGAATTGGAARPVARQAAPGRKGARRAS